MGVGAGLYMYVVVVQKFTFAISSPDEFLFSVLSQEIGREERLGNDSYLCQVGRKTLTLSINGSPTSASCVLYGNRYVRTTKHVAD